MNHSNELPDTFSALRALASDMIDGATANEVRLEIKQWTAAALTTRLDRAVAARKTYADALQAEDDATTARKVANSNAKAFIATAKRMLGEDFGTAPGKDWEAAGWPPGTTEAPDTIAGRQRLLATLAPWLAAHPDKEITQKGFTAVRAAAVLGALDDSLRGMAKVIGDRVKADAAAEAAEKALRAGMSGLADELDSLIPDDSADWYYFGLVPPANPAPPAPPEHLEAHPAGPGVLVAGCDRAPRGSKYVFSVQVVGRDPAPVPQEARRDPRITLESLPHGAAVRLSVHATNAAGRSAETAVVVVTPG